MGAESSAQRDGKSQEDASASASASAGELSAEVNVLQEGSSALDSKPLQKNGQISSLTSLNGHSEDNTLAEVGQPDGVSVAQKEETPETMDAIQDEVAAQVNGEKVEKESPDANDISAVEEKAAEEKTDDANEVGFKKIFRFVGFKFTLKKDKSEEKDPVKLLTVKDKEEEEVSGTDGPTKEAEAATAEEKSTTEEKEADTEASTAEAEVIKDGEKAEITDAPAESTAAEATDEAVKEEGAEKEGQATPPSQESTMSPFRKLFSGGLFSNLRKKASVKKTKEEEDKEAAGEEKTEETAASVKEKEEKDELEQETKEAAPATPEEEKTEPKEAALATPEEEKTEPKEAAPATPEEEKTVPKEEAPATPEEEKTELKEAAPATPEEEKTETEPKEEAPATPEEAKPETTPESEVTAETSAPAATTSDETKQEEDKAEPSAEEEKAPAEVTSEAELLSSQEKAKPQGSPLKKLFTGAGLKKLSTKKQKAKKDAETKPTESAEQAAEQLQTSTESTEAPKAESGPSSPEESGEHVIAVEVNQNESSQEAEGEVVSDGEKKKEGIIAWSSFKKLVTPKKRVKRSSESEDEATGEKPAKSATLSSSESAPLADKSVEEETKEDKPTEEEPKTENTEKLVSSTEEPKKKMDTSVSWEALMCMGGPKKRTRRTSDSDDEETKVEEEPAAPAAVEGEQEGKMEAAIVTSLTTESEGEGFSSPDPLSSPPERGSAWDTLKRMVMSKNKAKLDDKEESGEHIQSDSEAPKDESSFSLRKFLPGRRKKKADKASTEQGSCEEDSDTPAVVPLSEYDEQVESEQEAPEEPAADQTKETAADQIKEPAVVQIKVSAEDRSPSWIPAVVEDTDDKHDELSDIPEEAENAATPKSVDTDIAEDETEEEEVAVPPITLGRTGRRLSTAEVKPVAPAPAAEATSVPQGPKTESAEEVIGSIEAQISEIPPKTSVAVEDVPIEVASEKTEFEPPTVTAEAKTNIILEPHACDEAMAICTGLGTKEIAKVALEKPAMSIIESVAVIRDSLSTEVLEDEKPPHPEEATVSEDELFIAQVNQVETTELELVVENNKVDIQTASEGLEPESEKVAMVSIVPDESEIIQPATMSDNSPKTVVVNPIIPTSETAVCTESIAVTEPTVEAKELKMDMELLTAIEEDTEAVQDANEGSITLVTEPAIPVVVPSEEAPVITQAVVLIAPLSVETSDAVTIENASLSEPVADETIQVQETTEQGRVVETAEATMAETAESEISAVIEQASEKEEDQQVSEIEAQSMVIAQAVIQDAMEKVSEDAPEPKKPTTPTTTSPEPSQAVATTEKEIEVSPETTVITDTPVPILCEIPAPKPLCVAVEVVDTIPVEVTESIDAPVEEEKKPEEGLKKAAEVKVSEETVVVEEVVEIKAESQVEEEQSKEDTEVQEPDVKEAAEEVKPQSEEAMSDAPSEENKEKTFEIHMPVQVVLQTAQVIEEITVEEEAVEEFDNGPVAGDGKAASSTSGSKLSTLSEEPQETDSAEVSAPSQDAEAAAASQPETEKTSSVKCAEVMAQVIEVIEEAVKEIEPVSSEITAAS